MELFGMFKQDILEKLYSFCAYQERCIQDVQKKLDKLGIEEKYHKIYIHHLQEERFLNEERFVQHFVKSKLQGNKWGKRKIEFALKQKQVDELMIQNALNDLDEEQSNEILFSLAEKKNRSLKEPDQWKRQQKLFAYLAQKGFYPDEINRAIEQLNLKNH